MNTCRFGFVFAALLVPTALFAQKGAYELTYAQLDFRVLDSEQLEKSILKNQSIFNHAIVKSRNRTAYISDFFESISDAKSPQEKFHLFAISHLLYPHLNGINHEHNYLNKSIQSEILKPLIQRLVENKEFRREYICYYMWQSSGSKRVLFAKQDVLFLIKLMKHFVEDNDLKSIKRNSKSKYWRFVTGLIILQSIMGESDSELAELLKIKHSPEGVRENFLAWTQSVEDGVFGFVPVHTEFRWQKDLEWLVPFVGIAEDFHEILSLVRYKRQRTIFSTLGDPFYSGNQIFGKHIVYPTQGDWKEGYIPKRYFWARLSE